MSKRYLHTFLSFLILCCGFKGYSQTYCAITGNTSSATYLNNFKTTGGLTNITNNGSGYSAGGYNNATDKSASQINGGSVNFTTTTAGGTVGVSIWIDWNNNGVFDSNERVYTSGSYVTSPSGSFTVPASALPGKHRLRIVIDYNSTNPTPCALSTGRGEVEDYTFNVPPKAPTVSGTATICPGATTPITASGCTGTITWSNGATGSTINVPPGSYKATCSVDGVVGAASTAVVVSATNVAKPNIFGGGVYCPGETPMLNATGWSYHWMGSIDRSNLYYKCET